MRLHDIIVRDRAILGGTPVFRGTRVPFQALVDYLEGGRTLGEFLDDFPTVSKDAAVGALELTMNARHPRDWLAKKMIACFLSLKARATTSSRRWTKAADWRS